MNATTPQATNGSAESIPTMARRIHNDIEQSLSSHSAPRGTRLEALESTLKTRGLQIWKTMKRHPFLAIAAVGTCGVVAAVSLGVAEVAFGTAIAVAAYKVLREGEPPMQALLEVERELLRERP
jgi:hypothetical protein